MYDNFGLLITGVWQGAGDGAMIDVMSPVTEELIGQIPAATDADGAALLAAAQSARRTWAAVAAWDRCSDPAQDLRHPAQSQR